MMKKKPTTFLETKIEFPFPAKIPEYYLPDTSLRLEFYHRLGEASSEAEVDELIAELKDRFGKYPEEVSWLQSMTKIKLRAIDQGITLLKIEKFSLIIEKLLKDKTEKKQLFIKEPKSPEELEKLCSQFLKK